MISALTGLGGFVVGFSLGVWAYQSLYKIFYTSMENRFKQRLALAQGQAVQQRAKIEKIKEEMQRQYGNDLSDRHRVVMDEEIEAVLGAGPKGGGKNA